MCGWADVCTVSAFLVIIVMILWAFYLSVLERRKKIKQTTKTRLDQEE